MKQSYQSVAFRPDSLSLIDTMNGIVASYVAQGYRLTVRQLYYQLVARAIIENTERSYKRVTSIVNDAKLAGLMDWEAIEDRTRAFIRRSRWGSAASLLHACAAQFHMDMWAGQRRRVFCIVEKEALAGVLERECNKWDVPLLAARGYPSGTVLHEFVVEDILPAVREDRQSIVILHLGDHDPSGIDMTRDLTDRIKLFAGDYQDEVELYRIALTMEQIEAQRPPPNPAKATDARFARYAARFGKESWELDALEPSFLSTLLANNIQPHIDDIEWQATKRTIAEWKDRISDVAARFDDEDH